MGLVLGRKVQSNGIVIGDNIKIRVAKVRGSWVWLDIDAPKEVPVLREELIDKPEKREER